MPSSEDSQELDGYTLCNVVNSRECVEFPESLDHDVDWREKSFLISEDLKGLKHLSLTGLFVRIASKYTMM